MANLQESPLWEDGIYQIEVSDPVLGGPGGISNKQAKQLACRTSYLKQLVEKNILSVDELIENLSQELSQYVESMGGGSALPVGIPVAWPTATPPEGWLKCNGATFDLASYPGLAAVYPTGKLPDLRGEFIRGWDDGRGIDSGRAILSTQEDAIQNVIAKFYLRTASSNVSLPAWGGPGFTAENVGDLETNPFSVLTNAPAYKTRITLNTSGVVNTASETRPRNIVFNFIVRAA